MEEWRTPERIELDKKIQSYTNQLKKIGTYSKCPKDREFWVKLVKYREHQTRTLSQQTKVTK